MTQFSQRHVTPIPKKQNGSLDHEKSELQAQIRQRAYQLYEERGRRDGHEIEDWIRAEQEVHEKYGLRKAA